MKEFARDSRTRKPIHTGPCVYAHTTKKHTASSSRKHIVLHTKSFFDGTQLKETIKCFPSYSLALPLCVCETYPLQCTHTCVCHQVHHHKHKHKHEYNYMRANNHTKFLYVSKFPQNNLPRPVLFATPFTSFTEIFVDECDITISSCIQKLLIFAHLSVSRRVDFSWFVVVLLWLFVFFVRLFPFDLAMRFKWDANEHTNF